MGLTWLATGSPAVTGADFGPCDVWPVQWTCDVDTYSPALTGIALTAATRIVWALSGRRFGTCTVTLRPCADDCYGSWPFGWMPWSWSSYSSISPSYDVGGWLGYVVPECGSCRGHCSCGHVPQVELPSPVAAVTQVLVDGAALPTTSYRVDDNRYLVRTDGRAWPRCNDLLKDDGQSGTWSVTASYGQAVPASGSLAVGEMACQLLRAMNGEDCRLPPGVTQLVRQGVTISMLDIGTLLEKGRTGLYLVDAFLMSENPSALRTRSRVYGVDRITPRRAGT
jgi:hypothetical protein